MGEVEARSERDEPEDAEHDEGAHPCPQHPDHDVLAACDRCGSFYCDECLRLAGRAASSSRCAACPRSEHEARTFGGWLWVPALQLAVNAFLAVGRLVQDVSALAETVDPGWIPMLLIEMLSAVAFLGIIGLAGFHFVQKRRRAVGLMIGFYVAGLALALIDVAIAFQVEALLGEPQPIDGAVLARGIVSPMIWIAYFTNSQRVRETFVLD